MAASFFLTVPKDEKLYPFNVLREEYSLHFGVRSIANQWKDLLQAKPDVAVHPRLLPNEHNVSVVMGLQPSQAWTHGDITYAQHGKDVSDTISPTEPDLLTDAPALFERVAEGLAEDLSRLKRVWRLRTLAEEEREAWASAGVVVHGPMDKVHLAPGATLRDASLNTEQGDILLGPDSEVMEGCRIRGPFALGEDSVLRMGALVYGPTAIGKSCKAGGELSNVVIHDCSNKAHGGFLGNSVIGSWCNLGAETTCSNLKNTYGDIAEWQQDIGRFEKRGRTFCGLMLGDHSKTAIHTAFNTATVVGVMCNVFGDTPPPKHLPSFSWGAEGVKYDLDKALATAHKVMARRGQDLSTKDEGRIREAFKALV